MNVSNPTNILSLVAPMNSIVNNPYSFPTDFINEIAGGQVITHIWSMTLITIDNDNVYSFI